MGHGGIEGAIVSIGSSIDEFLTSQVFWGEEVGISGDSLVR